MGVRRRILLTFLLLLIVFAIVLMVYLTETEKDHDYRGTFVDNFGKEVQLI